MNRKNKTYLIFFALAILVLATISYLLFFSLTPTKALIISILIFAAFVIVAKITLTIHSQKITTDINNALNYQDNPKLKITKDVIKRFSEINKEKSILTKKLKNLRQSLENAALGLIMLDKNKNTILINKNAERLLGLNKTNDSPFYNDIFLNKQLKKVIKKALDGKKATDKVEISHNLQKIEVQATPIFEEKRDISGCIVSLKDTTQLDALANVKKDFIANVSHDIKTPITSIRSLIEALLAGAKDDPKTLSSFLNELDEQSKRLSSLASDILDLSKIENKSILTLEKLAIAPLLKKSIKIFHSQASNKKITINLNIYENPKSNVDAEQLIKAFNNLIDNSIKYTPHGGNILISLNKNNGSVKISIKDNGIGISKKELQRIFERFYRVSKSRSIKSGGTGLGLAIVKHVVENHQGKIEVRSQLKKGSEFIILLPIA